jgi:uncharacterized membrane protein
MFTPPGYRRRLLADLERWTAAGLISRDAADAIAREHKADSSHAILTVLAFVFAVLAAGGLIALVAANWNEIPREVRVVGLLAINLVVLGACLAFRLRRAPGSIAIECSAALSVMSAAATISLVGQIYNLPSNWPGFALAMMCVAGATALVARSTACLWLAAVAQYAYHVATVTDAPWFAAHHDVAASLTHWTSQHWIFLGFSILLIGLAISRWTMRSGPWTIFIAVLPLFWWVDDIEAVPAAVGRPLAWTACGIAVASIVARELRAGDRADATASALIGVFAIGLAALSTQNFTSNTLYQGAGLTAWYGLLAIAAAAALAAAAGARHYADRSTLWWLAAALAIPFAANRVLPRNVADIPALVGIVRLVLVVLLPLGLLAVEARLSERRKTFAFAIAAVIAIVCIEVWDSKDLLSLAWVLLGGSVLLGAAIVLTRFLAARRPSAPGEGVS